jgi:alkylation response protein AidB-like acyl-CoA dehydrogenase
MSLDRLDAGTAATDVPDDLDARFGDPREPGPFDHAAIVADDEARRVSGAASALLDEWDAAADAVPVDLGGRWGSTEELVQRWRPVFRRDPALGLAHGLSTFGAALPVWVAGDEAQRAEVAARLLRGERLAAAPAAFVGADAGDSGCAADLYGDRWLVRGVQRFVDDVDRSGSMLIVARTAAEAGPGSRSLLLWHADAATRPAVDVSQRVETGGLRGLRIGTVAFHGLPVPVDRTIGRRGSAAATIDAGARVTRAVIPALAVATVGASVELAVRYGAERSLYGGSVLDLPQSRALLAGAVADLLVADALASVAVRALHVAPKGCRVLTALSSVVVMELLCSAMQDLSVLFGSTFYARVAPYDLFEKLLRDVGALAVRNGDPAGLLGAALVHLPAWFERSGADGIDPSVFRLGAPVPPIRLDKLASRAGSGDPVGGALHDAAVRAAFPAGSAELATLERVADAVAALRWEVAALPPEPTGADAMPSALAVAHRVALAIAAAAVAGVSAAAGEASAAADPSIRSACLRRIQDRLTGRVRPLEPHLVERLVAFAADRTERGIRLDLSAAE